MGGHTHDLNEHDHHEHHDHEHNTGDNDARITALLDYTVKHNLSHTDELTKLSERLKDQGHPDAAAKVLEAAECFSKGNELLVEALELFRNS